MVSVKIKQRDSTDCGAVCLASICAHYQRKASVALIRQLSSTNQKGTTILGLIEGARQIGFEAHGFKGTMKSLKTIPLPAIAHVLNRTGNHHYVTIFKVTAKSITIMDPGEGDLLTVSPDKFHQLWTGVLVLLSPGPNFKDNVPHTPRNSRLLSLIRPHTMKTILVIVATVVYTLIGLSVPVYVQMIFDDILPRNDFHLLKVISIVMLILVSVQSLSNALKNVVTIQIGQQIDSSLIIGYYKHILMLPLSFFDSMKTGEITSRISDAVKIRALLNELVFTIMVNLLIVIGASILMFTYHWKLAAFILISIPLYILIFLITNRLNKKWERKLMEQSADLESQLVESIQCMASIKSLSLGPHHLQRTESRFTALLSTILKSGINGILSANASEYLSRTFIILLFWSGTEMVLGNSITPGELLSFYALFTYFTVPVANLIASNKSVQNAWIASDRLFEILDLEPEPDSKGKYELPQDGDIKVAEVSFTYGSRARVFQSMSLTIPRNSICAIVGESGCGKTTLMHILQKLYPLQSGNVLIGDTNLKDIDNTSLRNFISIVPQRIDLFDSSVLENIVGGDSNPDFSRIQRICHSLDILEFIENLPQGFLTRLGEQGASLSGGQKQRLAIARALYKNSKILILDEATSSLDAHAEEFVHKTIRLLKEEGKTIILITHRLHNVLLADKIIVLKNGNAAEEGTHEQLMSNHGPYFDLWMKHIPPGVELRGHQMSRLA